MKIKTFIPPLLYFPLQSCLKKYLTEFVAVVIVAVAVVIVAVAVVVVAVVVAVVIAAVVGLISSTPL